MDIPENSSSKIISGFPSIQNVAIEALSADRVLPRQVSAGASRGEQVITGSLTIVDENNPSQRITLGTVNGEFGIFGGTLLSNDPNVQTVTWKVVGQTFYFYDLNTNNVNVMQIGKLPDRTYGEAVAKSGYNVSDGVA